MHPRVQQALVSAGVNYRVRNHADCPGPIRSPQDFAACLGYELGRITKTLFCRSTRRDKYALVVAAMTRKIDFTVIAGALDIAAGNVVSTVLAAARGSPTGKNWNRCLDIRLRVFLRWELTVIRFLSMKVC